jgi:hypothetical protein
MEFILLAVVVLFLIPFPSKWKFVWQLRLLSLALLALIGGLTLTQMYGQTGQIGGVALMLLSGVFIYLALRRRQPARQSGDKKK